MTIGQGTRREINNDTEIRVECKYKITINGILSVPLLI